MHLTDLTVERLRIVERAELEFGDGINVLTGANGSGKTSILEGIYLLGTGRSFRATNARELVTRGQSRLLCRGVILSADGGTDSVGIEQGEGPARIRRNGETVKTASSLARMLPMVLVSPDSQRLLTDGAELRRGMIDWALFHVEPRYGELHARYRRSLRQRNAGLKQGLREAALQAFDAEFAALGEEIHRLRASYLDEGMVLIESFVQGLVQKGITLRYEAGWDTAAGLSATLAVSGERDRARGFTGSGPHRADLRLDVEGVRASRVLSRGESKLCVIGMLLSQVQFLREVKGEKCVVLLDELASELDVNSRTRVFRCLEQLGCQAFLTAVSPELVNSGANMSARMFHVEQGMVSVMV